MLFSSITFLVFFLPAVLLFYYAFPNLKYKNTVLFLASLLFYAWGEPKFIVLMFCSIVFNYNIGFFLKKNSFQKRKLLIFGIAVNLLLLFVFKYLGFSCRIINALITHSNLRPLTRLNLIMPIGISFYTFQEISYLVDVYKNPDLAQEDFVKLGLYISFFPQLIAGPIVRYHDINTQISDRSLTLSQFSAGLERFIIGLSKKILLANNFAFVCDSFYNSDFFGYGTFAAWCAAFSYAMQIYYDFSGYSDMAIGLAKLFGFELLENFNYPYAANSITDFWKRWHISLTNFFRDYVYIPLGGNRKGKVRTILNRYIVFFTTGLWHGASFNFILWGLAHGSLMTIERLFKPKSKKVILSIISRIYTLFSILILWILFRNGTKQTIKLILKMFGINYTRFSGNEIPFYKNDFLMLCLDKKFFAILAIGILFCFPWWKKIHIKRQDSIAFVILTLLKYMVLAVLLVLCYANLADSAYNPFIYFRF